MENVRSWVDNVNQATNNNNNNNNNDTISEPDDDVENQNHQAVGQQPVPGQVSAAPTTNNPETRRFIQQQLILLLHAHKCRRQESQVFNPVNTYDKCALPYCQTMKNVLTHVTLCKVAVGEDCPFNHCTTSKQIITHWKHCTKSDCDICVPLKSNWNYENLGPPDPTPSVWNKQVPVPHSSPVDTSSPHMEEVRQAYEGLNIASSSMSGNSTGPPTVSSPQKLPLSSASAQNRRNMPVSSLPSPMPKTSNDSSTPFSAFYDGSYPILGLDQTGAQPQSSNNSSEFTASTVPSTKEWHLFITPELRNHFVFKLAQAVFPSPEAQIVFDRKIIYLVEYAKKVERDMYETANSRSEYYHLLAEKIYKIQKELEEKFQQRKEDEEQQQSPTQAYSFFNDNQ